jgi:hypothetical protein
MALPKLYRFECTNNGVFVVLTEDGYEAYLAREEFYGANGTYKGIDPRLTRRMAEGTMTFVHARFYANPSVATVHYGTLETMDELVALCDTRNVGNRIIYIPFSNASAIRDDLKAGYAPSPVRLATLIFNALQARQDMEVASLL